MSNIKPHIRISATAVSSTFVDDIRAIIEQGKQQAYMSVNASMIETYWHIGERIVKEEQQGSKRAEYGAQIIDFLAEKLADEYGESYSPRYLRSFRQFYALFPDFDIWKSRFPNLTWTHIYRTLRVGDDTAIRWYLGEAYPDATFQTITPDNYQEFGRPYIPLQIRSSPELRRSGFAGVRKLRIVAQYHSPSNP